MSDPRVVVRESNLPINGLPKLIIGSKPIDGGHYIFNPDEREAFLSVEPEAEPYLRPFVGSREFLQGGMRWILHLADVPPQILKTLPRVRERIAAVRDYRLASKSKPTQALAMTPKLYHVNVIPVTPFLVVPEVSSERRNYIPIAWLEPPVIPSNKIRILPNASLWQFGLLTSAMHMAWVRSIGGRLESRFQYGIGIIYNTFPLPPVQPERQEALTPHADAVLYARAKHPTRHWPTCTTLTSCLPTSAKPIRPWIAPWTGCTVAAASRPNASAWNTSSACTKKWSRPSRPWRNRSGGGGGRNRIGGSGR